ncbi:MAG: sugar ABC transporter substrate-binding protein [Lachnospiraceae bacterium]|nr:sugar ABC transporter substrate-binding protein [Lachnospiraceae bacterium]
MHSIRRRLIAIVVTLALLGGVTAIGLSGLDIRYPEPEENDEPAASYAIGKDTIYLWYTDESLTDYLNTEAVNYSSVNDEIRVVPVLVSGRDYLEGISAASMTDEELPDLFIATSDTLEKAHLAGLAEPVTPPDDVDITSVFSQTAINAVTYKGELVAYPMFMECSAMCYNYTYLEQWARNTLEAEIRAQLAEEEKAAEESSTTQSQTTNSSKTSGTAKTEEEKKAEEEEKARQEAELQEKISSMVSDEDVTAYVEEHIPATIDDLLVLSNDFDAPEGVDTIFKWAVTDIFYNYFFIGDSIDVGGRYGDDPGQIDIYNEDAIKGLTTYQKLNQFFSISTDDVSYGGVIEDFEFGRILMTIVTSDAVRALATARDEGDMDYEYRFTALPDISENASGRSMSVTDAIVVNGYSSHKSEANDFAYFLSTGAADTLYDWTGKVSVLKDADYGEHNDELQIFAQEYEDSVPLPKMLETSNYWVNLEMLFASVWDGADANEGLKKLSEQMKLQVTGEPVTEETIIIPEEVEEEDEIIEEEAED